MGHDLSGATRWTFSLAEAFSQIAQCAKAAKFPSTDEIAEHLVEEGMLEVTTRKDGPLEARNFVFAVLRWQTMLYGPALGICPPRQLAVTDEQNGYRGQAFMALKQHHLSTKRPVHEFLMGFGILLPPANYCPSTDLEEKKAFEEWETIGPEIINAFLLDSIGHVKFKWVDVMSCHLEFDGRTNTIFLFRFPSFRAVHYTAVATEKETSVIHAAAAPASSSRQRAVEEDIHQTLREILTSYRLLFGQNKQARKLFSRCEPAAGPPGNVQDQLLSKICGHKSFRLRIGSLDKD